MKTYNLNPAELAVEPLNDREELVSNYFYSGHPTVRITEGEKIREEDPDFLIPEVIGEELGLGAVIDQNGSEFDDFQVDRNGLIKAKYFCYGLSFEHNKEEAPKDYTVKLTGYVHKEGKKHVFSVKSFEVEKEKKKEVGEISI